ncbi:hypothetical protein AHiyo4_07650 [Arthrobacter sp. Hiyo4]|nr:hypothetical protein AHiyo4_07650 [Arthrobacter sp. Hiyo4]
MGVIASQVTQAYNATGAGNAGAWVTGAEIVEGVLEARASVLSLGLALDPNVIVLNDLQWARAIGRLATAGVLPREAGNPVVSGAWPQALGLTWVSTPHTPTADPILLDNTQLGGMADEDLGGPGYKKAGGIGVETKAIRKEETDSYLVRARRVTVPVVREASAAIRLTNTGL